MIFYRISELMLPTFIQIYDKKNHFILDKKCLILRDMEPLSFEQLDPGCFLFVVTYVLSIKDCTLPHGVIGRQCSVIEALPGHFT